MRRRETDAIPESERWNRNIHYHPLLLRLGPADRALDVGCGGGMLSRQLARACGDVIGIDLDEPSINEARALTDALNVEYILGDALIHPFADDSFDLVVSVAALHHTDAVAALRRFAALTRPGGCIGIIGIGRSSYPRDLMRDVVAAVSTQFEVRVRKRVVWDHSAPMVWPPPLTDHAMSKLSAELLPGSTFQRLLHGRYSLTWTKPGAPTAPIPGARQPLSERDRGG